MRGEFQRAIRTHTRSSERLALSRTPAGVPFAMMAFGARGECTRAGGRQREPASGSRVDGNGGYGTDALSDGVRMNADDSLHYEAADPIQKPLAVGLGLQLAVLTLNSAVLLPSIVFRAAGAERFLLWAVFAGMLACGIVTIVQAVGGRRFGAGYLMVHGASSPFIAVCVAALVQAGPAMLATLVLASGLAQAAFSQRLALLHRILTPVVTGTVMMLLPVTVMPVLLAMLNELPAGAPPVAGPLCGFVTLAVIVGVYLKGTGGLRRWAPVAGIAAGAAVGALFGIYDTGLIAPMRLGSACRKGVRRGWT